jgi:hypothetical protein
MYFEFGKDFLFIVTSRSRSFNILSMFVSIQNVTSILCMIIPVHVLFHFVMRETVLLSMVPTSRNIDVVDTGSNMNM